MIEVYRTLGGYLLKVGSKHFRCTRKQARILARSFSVVGANVFELNVGALQKKLDEPVVTTSLCDDPECHFCAQLLEPDGEEQITDSTTKN